MLKNVSRFTTGALVAVTVLSGALLFSNNVSAEKVLRFSHTDNPGGSRQAAAEVFAKISRSLPQEVMQRICPA